MKLKISLPKYSLLIITTILVVLKLTNVIGWSWLWVFSPLLFVILAPLSILLSIVSFILLLFFFGDNE